MSEELGTGLHARIVGHGSKKLYFDCPGTADWAALAKIGDSFVPALDPNHILVLQP